MRTLGEFLPTAGSAAEALVSRLCGFKDVKAKKSAVVKVEGDHEDAGMAELNLQWRRRMEKATVRKSTLGATGARWFGRGVLDEHCEGDSGERGGRVLHG